MGSEEGRIHARIEQIHAQGSRKLLIGESRPYEGPAQDLANRFTLALELRSVDTEEAEAVRGFLAALEVPYVCRFALAGIEYPLHVTIGEGVYEGPKSDRNQVFDRVDRAVTALVGRVSALEFSLNAAAFDGTAVILAAQMHPPELEAVREELAGIYEGAGLRPLRIADLLHATVGRLTSLPSPEQRMAFLSTLETWRGTELPARPLRCLGTPVYLGDTLSLLTSEVG